MEVLKEEQEWEILKNWLEANNYKFTHIANEIWISGRIWMLVNRKKIKQGLKKWFPDYCIILKRRSLLFLELKRKRKTLKSWKLWSSPSKVSEEQKIWIKELNEIANIEAHICYWAEEAIRLIEEMEEF